MDLPVPLITEIMADVSGLPQERVQNRATYSGRKVFTERHHRDDRGCTVDNVEFIKGLDKFNLPRVGDVMVPAPQITKGLAGHVEQVVSWFDRKSQVAADGPLYRFQPKRPGRSSRSKLKRLSFFAFSRVGVEKVTVESPQLHFFDRGRCCLGCSLEFLDIVSSAPF